MEISIQHGPGNACAQVQMQPGDNLTAEGGSMISMSSNLEISTTTNRVGKGSMGRAVKRMLAGESLFLNHYTAPHGDGEVWLATPLPGDMMVYELNNETLIVQGHSFVACEEGVDIDLGWQGFKSFLSGENIFWVKLSGSGKAVVNAFGALYPVEVNEPQIVDTGHIVAFPDTLDFSISKAGKSWVSSILGGEGLVCRFSGQGAVWCQSHNPDAFGSRLGPQLKARK